MSKMKPSSLIISTTAIIFSLFIFLEEVKAFDQNHLRWNDIATQSVTWAGMTSTVNYKKLKESPAQLELYLKELSEVKESDFNSWSRSDQLAFLINAYNAWTLKLIIDNYPVQSIKKIGGLFSNPWKKEFVHLFGRTTSLDWIEHEKIRPSYNEPRIHFAVVCASIGCPGLRSEAFTGNKLEQQLEDSTRKFLNDTSRNYVDPKKNELQLSSIFKWYKDDFIKAKGNIQAFVYPYINTLQDQSLAQIQNYKIKYLNYDWSLNEK